MPWYDAIKNVFDAIDGEYDRRIKTASNVKAYHPEGDPHHHGVLAHNDPHPIEEEAGGSGTEGALAGAGGSQYVEDGSEQVIVQH